MSGRDLRVRCHGRGLSASVVGLAAVLVSSALSSAAWAEAPQLGGKLRPTFAEPADVQPHGFSQTPSSTEPYAVCPAPEPGRAGCLAIIDPPSVKTESGFAIPGVARLEGGGEGGGFDAKELQEAYKLPATGGSAETVAIVDAYHDPNAEEDLREYRKTNHLPECKKENLKGEITHCFRQINQHGEEGNYPTDKYPRIEESDRVEDWGVEISLDLDMVSAACPECKIVLVEANSNSESNLLAAEEEAEKLESGGKKLVTEISNSWGGPEFNGETEDDRYFNAGIPITAASGDSAFGVNYPAASKYVISVGGTKLERATGSSRGWQESVWINTGSGCSAYESPDAWQAGLLCNGEGGHRITNDVAAVAAEGSPVSVRDSYEYTESNGVGTGKLGWINIAGTSVSTPLVAGVEGHASATVKSEGAEAFYKKAMFNVTSGTNGDDCSSSYLCTGEEGYNGPTGFGTPDGPIELSVSSSAITAPPQSIKPASAVLTGYVNPAGVEASYHFEYGRTTSYGASAPIPSGNVTASSAWQAVSTSVTGLEWETTYHYRLVATSISGDHLWRG